MLKFLKLFLVRKKNLKIRFLLLTFLFSGLIIKGQVNSYSFSQSQGSFTPLLGGTVLDTASDTTGAASLDNLVYPVSLPFDFYFNGMPYHSLYVSTNGFITFGAAPVSNNLSPISNDDLYDGAVSAWGRDLNAAFVNNIKGNITWDVVGSAPNREIVIQWTDFKPLYSTSTTNIYSFSFQIRLKETSNVISVVYKGGSYLVGNMSLTQRCQIGLRGSSNMDFNNRSNSTNSQFMNSSAGLGNNYIQVFHTINSVPGMPSDGFTYTWIPPSCFAPNLITINNITGSAAQVSWAALNPTPVNGYDVYYSTSSTPPTTTTTPNITGVMTNSATLSSLLPITAYYVWVRSLCSTTTGAWSAVKSFVTKCQQPLSIISTTNATVCPGQATVLSVVADAGANINWYDAQWGGNLVGTGNSYTTPVLSNTTTYYATAFTGINSQTTGISTPSASAINGMGTTNFGIVFDVLNTATIEKVTVYPVTSVVGATGTLTIDIVDGTNTIIRSKTFTVIGGTEAAPYENILDLDFTLPPGTNYKITPKNYIGINGLLFDPPSSTTSNYGYPFTVQNAISITTSTLSAAPGNTPKNNIYYYFYNWIVSTMCESDRQAVTATVDSNCLSTSEVDKKDRMEVYPNPFSDIININKVELLKSIKVTDISGKLVKVVSRPEATLRLGDLSQGMYILQLEMKDGSKQSIKIIKK